MARSQQIKPTIGSKSSLATSSAPNKKLLSAGLFRVDSDNVIDIENTLGYFLLNPSSWDDHKSSNWVQHNIPGESDPILQWTSGGARTITIEALVTRDHSGYDIKNPPDFTDKALNLFGKLAGKLAGIVVPPLGDLLPILGGSAGVELSITEQLNYYRSMMYPTTEDGTKLVQSPPLLALFVGDSLSYHMNGKEVNNDSSLWVMMDLRIKINKQLPNLSPLEATVTMQLQQYTQVTKDVKHFRKPEPNALPNPF